ncbi:MAG: hypothetical protein HQL93_14015, partial [Magnetococcales bacterium]|nr:hypothetical protein [Magnetococcales bacterium]
TISSNPAKDRKASLTPTNKVLADFLTKGFMATIQVPTLEKKIRSKP